MRSGFGQTVGLDANAVRDRLAVRGPHDVETEFIMAVEAGYLTGRSKRGNEDKENG